MSRKRDPLKIGPHAFLKTGEPANYFRAWREHRGLTQKEVADFIGTKPPSISRYEQGDLPYTQRVLEGLALVYRARPGDLLNGPPPDAPSPVGDLTELPVATQREILTSLEKILKKAKRIQIPKPKGE